MNIRSIGFRLLIVIVSAWPMALHAAPAVSPPWPDNCDVPCGITLVGTRDGVADAHGEVVFVMRNIGNNPVGGASVVIDFCACSSALGFCVAAQQPDPNVWVSTDGCYVNGITDRDGIMRLSLVGHATTSDPGAACAPVIYADGMSFEYSIHPKLVLAAFDLDGAQGVAPTDLARWLEDSFASSYRSRADYNCSRSVTPVDLAIWLDVSLAGGSQTSAANTLCN